MFSVRIESWEPPWVNVTVLNCAFPQPILPVVLMIPKRICPRVQPGLDPTEKAKGLRSIGRPQCPQPMSPLRPVCACPLRQALPSLCSCPPTRALDATAPPQHPSLSGGRRGAAEVFPGLHLALAPAWAQKDIEGTPRLGQRPGTRDPPPDLRTQCYSPVLAFTWSLNRLGAGPRAHSLQQSPPSPSLSPSPFSSHSRLPFLFGKPCHQGGSFFQG